LGPSHIGLFPTFLSLSARTRCSKAPPLRFYVVLLPSGRDTISERVPHLRCGKPMFGFYMHFEDGQTPPWRRIVLNPDSLLGRCRIKAARLIYFVVPQEREPSARLESRYLDFEMSRY
jgi:hypothetical protein